MSPAAARAKHGEAQPRWLADVRLRALRRVLWCRALWAQHAYDDEQALAITHSEVERALAPVDPRGRAELAFYRKDDDARRLSAELEQLADLPDERWQQLCEALALTAAEANLLALTLAAELHPPLRRVYGYLQDEPVALDATPVLAAALWRWPSHEQIAADSALVRWSLARPSDAAREPWSRAAGWSADPQTLAYLHGGDDAGRGLLGRVVAAPRGPLLHERECDEIVAFLQALGGEGASAPPSRRVFDLIPPIAQVRSNTPRHGGALPRFTVQVEINAPAGAGKSALAAQVAQRLGTQLIEVDCEALARLADPAAAAARELRRARLDGAIVLWSHAEALSAQSLGVLGELSSVALLGCETALAVPAGGTAVRRSWSPAPLDRERRLALWSSLARAKAPQPVAEWALRAGEIVTLSRVAPAGDSAAREVCRRLLMEVPGDLLAPLALPYTWEDLVLPPQVAQHLHEFESQVSARGEVLDDWGLARLTPLGRGVTALFAGPSGTGKTMAAQVMARSLGMDLFRVDLAGVVNKYIGETEKHLRTVFDACERAPVMLFFDEADALFGKRMQVNDAHDRFANIEIDYVLQRIEQFDGVAVLATNRKGDLDSAFLRRLRFIVDFAPPTVDERERLWRLALEGGVDRAGRSFVGDVDWPALARELDLTGAGIKSAAIAAAFLARSDGASIGADHLLAAARRELEKQGVVLRAQLAVSR